MVDSIARNLADVPRWAIIRTIRSQSVAEHQFQVARIAIKLWDQLLGELRPRDYACKCMMIEYALTHDDDEVVTGDIPSNAKKTGGVIVKHKYIKNGVFDWVAKFVKIADVIEGLLFIEEEIRMGNSTLKNLRGKNVEEVIRRIEEFNEWYEYEYSLEIDKEIVFKMVESCLGNPFPGAFYVEKL